MKKNERIMIFGAIILAVVLGAGIYFDVYGMITGDLTSGKQYIMQCEQTLSVGQSKDIYSCLQAYNTAITTRVGNLYVKNLESYSAMQLPAISEIMCHKEGTKEYITVKTGSSQWTNYVTDVGDRNPYTTSTAMTSMTSGGKIVYMRFDGCIGTTGTIYSVDCPSSSWTDCRRATGTNIKIWISTTAQGTINCLPGWTETDTCWDGSTVVERTCVNYQKVTTGVNCPAEPPSSGGGTGGTTPPPACTPTTSVANALWSLSTCDWVCNTGYEKVAGQCVAVTTPPTGGTTTPPPIAPPTAQDDTLLWVIAIALFLGVGALGFYAIKMKR